jgi:hypothetical protein
VPVILQHPDDSPDDLLFRDRENPVDDPLDDGDPRREPFAHSCTEGGIAQGGSDGTERKHGRRPGQGHGRRGRGHLGDGQSRATGSSRRVPTPAPEVPGGDRRRYPPMRMAEKVERALGLHPSKEQHKMLAKGQPVALRHGRRCALRDLRRRSGAVDWGQGLAFGAVFSLVGDELMTPLMGLAEPPQAYPLAGARAGLRRALGLWRRGGHDARRARQGRVRGGRCRRNPPRTAGTGSTASGRGGSPSRMPAAGRGGRPRVPL